ncbi:ribosome biogenesis GTP-binding protein YihA/YsxC [Christensenella sp. MSJ-20]|uniref:ribosome biogenesis GTP-binding protein YihA/YsxC n=1 Tax=Christensenella sp. MSJ-20 TaxID=2841518 RepID=UPI000D7ABAC7|nr:MAG: YihA family ribosome biogenesis GTP-binding protein [Bacillota bacterium]QWT55541.1 ribosome biogenesis GTP-binding protein YihA/YsxC [Christensenella sp. MSJ-20]
MRITKAKLAKTVYQTSQYEDFSMAEIAVVGRSNAGKSSLINKLCNNGKLARVSSEPGKTRSINFFLINEELMLVDLPGYGFARRSAGERQSWQQLVEGYFTVTQRLRHLFLLCDIRHAPSAGDLQMVEYLRFYRIPFTLVATKADKIAKSKRKQAARSVASAIGTEDFVAFSAMDGYGMEELLDRIGKISENETAFYGLQNTVDK